MFWLAGRTGLVFHMGVHVNHRDALADEHVAQERQEHETRRQHDAVVHAAKRQVVHLEPARQPADAAPLAVSVGDDHDLVALHEQALCELVDVVLHAAHRWVEEVGDHADIDHGQTRGSLGARRARAEKFREEAGGESAKCVLNTLTFSLGRALSLSLSDLVLPSPTANPSRGRKIRRPAAGAPVVSCPPRRGAPA